MVEDHDLDVGARRQGAELGQPVGVERLDQNEAGDRRQVDRRDVGHRDLVGKEGAKLAHVAVDRAAQHHGGLRVELVGRDHAGEGVEVGVGVRGDKFGGAHVRPTIPRSSRLEQPGQLVPEGVAHRVGKRHVSR